VSEIQEVVGFAAFKSELTQFFSLDEMVRTNSPEMLSEFTEEKLKELPKGKIAFTQSIGVLTDKIKALVAVPAATQNPQGLLGKTIAYFLVGVRFSGASLSFSGR
jgi:hypothetical protein